MTEFYEDAYRRTMDGFHPQLWQQLKLVPTLSNELGFAVLDYLLELACQTQNEANIGLGRRALVGLPREWLVACVEDRAAVRLSLSDEWEYRRYLEACCFIDPQLAERVVQRGLVSSDSEVREAALEFEGRCAAFATMKAEWLR